MKAAISLLFLFVGLCSFAAQAQIDPAHLDDGVYKQEADEFAFSESIYNGEIDDPAIIQVMLGGGEPCTRNTPVGIACICKGGVISRHPYPGWVQVHPFLYIRANWHLTNLKGQHAGGNICYRDRDATPAEREQFHRTGH